MGKQGKREFSSRFLRLMEVFRTDEVAAAVRDAIARGLIGFDAGKHLCSPHRAAPAAPRYDGLIRISPQAYVAMIGSAEDVPGPADGAAS